MRAENGRVHASLAVKIKAVECVSLEMKAGLSDKQNKLSAEYLLHVVFDFFPESC